MGELIKVEKILGKPYLMVGSADTDIILNGKGNIKVRFGNSFLDLISNGKVCKTTDDTNSINIVQNKNDIGAADGWYFVKSEDSIYFQINGVLYPVLSNRDDVETSEDYLAINYNQNLTLEQIRTAQRNLKVIIDNQDNIAILPTDFVYFNSDDKVHYYNNNGTLVELYLNLSSGGVVKDKVTINLENNLHGSGDLNVIGPNGLQVKNQRDYLNIVVNNNEIVLDTNTSGIKFNSKEGITYINGKYISIGYPPTYNYNFEVDGNVYVKDKAVLNSGIISDNFIEGIAGYRLENINSEWTLEVDNLIVRNSAKGPFGDGSSKEKNFITRGLNTNYFFEPQGVISSISEIVPEEETGEVIPIKYKISINGIYNINIGNYLYFEKYSYGYDVEIPENSEGEIDISTLIPTTKLISKGRVKVEELKWVYNKETFIISGCIITATIDENVLDNNLEEYLNEATTEERKRELEKLPDVGDTLYLKTQDSLYLHSIRTTDPKTGECLDKSYLEIESKDKEVYPNPRLRIGNYDGLVDYLDKTIIEPNTIGVFAESIQSAYLRSLNITTKLIHNLGAFIQEGRFSHYSLDKSKVVRIDVDNSYYIIKVIPSEDNNVYYNFTLPYDGTHPKWNNEDLAYLSDLEFSGETAETIMAKINSQDEIIFTKHTAHLAGAGDTSVSDIRYKNNIEAITGVLSLVLNSPGFKYNWMDEKDISIGTSAQYWNKYYPELTRELHNSILTFSYERYPIILQEAFKEEHRLREMEKEAFEERIKYLEQELNNLKNLWQETKKLK